MLDGREESIGFGVGVGGKIGRRVGRGDGDVFLDAVAQVLFGGDLADELAGDGVDLFGFGIPRAELAHGRIKQQRVVDPVGELDPLARRRERELYPFTV